MSKADAIKWNERYRSEAFQSPREFLIEQAAYLPSHGIALDLAMGAGGNAGYLIEHGVRVIGVDVSEEGVRRAKQRWPAIEAAVLDLEHYRWPRCAFDVILIFYYCQRELWPQLRSMLRPGGVLIFETLTQDMLQIRPGYNPDYLLAPDELRHAFADWNISFYREGWIDVGGHWPRAVARLVARAG